MSDKRGRERRGSMGTQEMEEGGREREEEREGLMGSGGSLLQSLGRLRVRRQGEWSGGLAM